MISKISNLTVQAESALLLVSLLFGSGLAFYLSFQWAIYFLNTQSYISAVVLITFTVLMAVGALLRMPIALIIIGITAVTLGSAVATNTYGLFFP